MEECHCREETMAPEIVPRHDHCTRRSLESEASGGGAFEKKRRGDTAASRSPVEKCPSLGKPFQCLFHKNLRFRPWNETARIHRK